MFVSGKAPFEVYDEHRRCTAMSKQAQRRCRQLATPGRSVCRFHGGKSLRGEDHPAYRDGASTKEARAQTSWIIRLGRALNKMDRARNADEMGKAVEFAKNAIASEPGRG